MTTAAAFSGELDSFGAQIVAEGTDLLREVSLEALRGVVFGTPVGQPRLWKRKAPKGYVGGFHRAQWQLTSDEPAEGQVSRRDASEVLSDGESAASDLELGSTAWITNNGPAITRLEFDGHSSQAREGWVRAVVERIRSKYDLRS